MPRAPGAAVAALLAVVLAASAAPAQERPAQQDFLFINQERLLTGSRAGQALLEEDEVEQDRLRAEARAIDAAFEAEERALTERRAELSPEEFRALADDFDARVVEARREQDERSAALSRRFDQRRRQFYASVAPILVMFMERYAAKAIFDETSMLLADQSINITAEVIAEIDARMPPEPAEETPEAPAEDAPAED